MWCISVCIGVLSTDITFLHGAIKISPVHNSCQFSSQNSSASCTSLCVVLIFSWRNCFPAFSAISVLCYVQTSGKISTVLGRSFAAADVEDNVVTASMRNLLIVLCESCSPCIIFGLNRISLHEHIRIKRRGSMLNTSCDISTTFTPPFKYTMELEEEGYLPFLDILLTRETGTDVSSTPYTTLQMWRGVWPHTYSTGLGPLRISGKKRIHEDAPEIQQYPNHVTHDAARTKWKPMQEQPPNYMQRRKESVQGVSISGQCSPSGSNQLG